MEELSSQAIRDAVVEGLALLEGGIVDRNKWSRAMSAMFGKPIRPHLEFIWFSAHDEWQKRQPAAAKPGSGDCKKNRMKFEGYTDAELKRWAWLRAIEWDVFPAYWSQLFAPALCIYYPWYSVLIVVVVLGILWVPVRYAFVSVGLASFSCLAVMWLKWPAAICSGIFLIMHHQIGTGFVAVLWPVFAGLVGVPGSIGIHEAAFGKKLGLHVSHEGSERLSDASSIREIVIVDDEEGKCELYALVLRDLLPDASFQSFADGLQAWQSLSGRDPDLLIMDINRPGLDGIETLRRLATLHKTYPILVASSLFPHLENDARAAAGALRVSLMTQPVKADDLRREVLNLISTSKPTCVPVPQGDSRRLSPGVLWPAGVGLLVCGLLWSCFGHSSGGYVASARYAVYSRGSPTFLDIGKPFPEEAATVVIWGKDRHKFAEPPEVSFFGKRISVKGSIEKYHGRTEIIVHDPSQTSILN